MRGQTAKSLDLVICSNLMTRPLSADAVLGGAGFATEDQEHESTVEPQALLALPSCETFSWPRVNGRVTACQTSAALPMKLATAESLVCADGVLYDWLVSWLCATICGEVPPNTARASSVVIGPHVSALLAGVIERFKQMPNDARSWVQRRYILCPLTESETEAAVGLVAGVGAVTATAELFSYLRRNSSKYGLRKGRTWIFGKCILRRGALQPVCEPVNARPGQRGANAGAATVPAIPATDEPPHYVFSVAPSTTEDDAPDDLFVVHVMQIASPVGRLTDADVSSDAVRVYLEQLIGEACAHHRRDLTWASITHALDEASSSAQSRAADVGQGAIAANRLRRLLELSAAVPLAEHNVVIRALLAPDLGIPWAQLFAHLYVQPQYRALLLFTDVNGAAVSDDGAVASNHLILVCPKELNSRSQRRLDDGCTDQQIDFLLHMVVHVDEPALPQLCLRRRGHVLSPITIEEAATLESCAEDMLLWVWRTLLVRPSL